MHDYDHMVALLYLVITYYDHSACILTHTIKSCLLHLIELFDIYTSSDLNVANHAVKWSV